jgi:hypothetical protein
VGFNKRFISEEIIISVYEQGGYKHLVEYITNPDALLISDKFSNKIIKLIQENNSEQRVKILMRYGNGKHD